IALMRTFAGQAVIAIQNARLLTDLRESLDRQTAMSEVLQVISKSPGQLQPVFDAILASALRICDAQFGNMGLLDERGIGLMAERDLPPAYSAWLHDNVPLPIVPGGAMERGIAAREAVHIADLGKDDYRHPQRRALVELAGARTMVWVPMVKDDE